MTHKLLNRTPIVQTWKCMHRDCLSIYSMYCLLYTYCTHFSLIQYNFSKLQPLLPIWDTKNDNLLKVYEKILTFRLFECPKTSILYLNPKMYIMTQGHCGLMWNDVDQTTAAPLPAMWLRWVCSQPLPHCSQKVQAVFEPHPSATERRTVSLVPNGLLKLEETGTEEEQLLPQTRCDPQTGAAFPSRRTVLLQMRLHWCFWQLFCIWLWSRHKRVDVKFHNQLHFKSYMHILGHDETLLCEGPDVIPVDVDSDAFYLQWFSDICQGRSKFGTVLSAFLSPLTQGIAKPLDVKYYLKKKWNGTITSSHFKMYDNLLSWNRQRAETCSLIERSSLPSSKCITVV